MHLAGAVGSRGGRSGRASPEAPLALLSVSTSLLDTFHRSPRRPHTALSLSSRLPTHPCHLPTSITITPLCLPPLPPYRCHSAAASPPLPHPVASSPATAPAGRHPTPPSSPPCHHTCYTLPLPRHPLGLALPSRVRSRHPFLLTACACSLCMQLAVVLHVFSWVSWGFTLSMHSEAGGGRGFCPRLVQVRGRRMSCL